MPWMPVIDGGSDKAASLAIGVIVAAGMATMFVVGVPWIRAFLYSVPAACVVALGIRYWHNRHNVGIISLVQPGDEPGKTVHSR